MMFFRIFQESIRFAFHALRVNKVRTILSLLGVTIGILTIISVFTMVDSLERNIRNSVEGLGSNVMYVQKWPWGSGGGEYAWWKYFQRPEPAYSEMKKLTEELRLAEEVSYVMSTSSSVKAGNNSVEGVEIKTVSANYMDIWNYNFSEGRYFSAMESQSGSPKAVIGYDVAAGLFPNESAIGKEFRVLGRKLLVVGVIEKQGQSLVGGNVDASILVPARYVAKLMSLSNRNNSQLIVKAKEGVEMAALRSEVEGAMRKIRRLKPKVENNFSINEISMISSQLDELFDVLGIAGAVIGGFSILVGGFGIANIMFVSVKERTNQIGIQMSLGAKRHFILLQFLFESITLCLIGGGVGLLMVVGLTPFISEQMDFELQVSLLNILQALAISLSIGVISGFWPAYQASRLNPVEAIRTGQ